MRFYYTKYGLGTFRPVISLELVYKTKKIKYDVLIDSGADFCLFDEGIARLLGVPLEEGIKTKTYGFTGDGQIAYIHAIGIKLGNKTYTAKAGFVENMNETGFGIVGQVGFFDRFKVTFDYSEKTIELDEKRKKYRSLFWSNFINKTENL